MNFSPKAPFALAIIFSLSTACQEVKRSASSENEMTVVKELPNINLSNWKLTLPVGDPKPLSFEAPEILNYATNDTINKFMYKDSTDGSLVFYAYPASSTANSSYSRTELREQMLPGDDDVNWTFEEGGILEATIEMQEVSRARDEENKYHKVIILQIHGRLTDEQKELIGQKDNDAPPILKVYWHRGKVRLLTKRLENLEMSPEELLHKEAWKDDEEYIFEEEVGFEKFKLSIEVADRKMVVTLNEDESKTYDNIHMKKWGVFENYFKAGNYLQTKDKDAFAKVKFYDLEVTH